MKFRFTTLLGLALLACTAVTAQDFQVPANVPSTKEEYVQSEPDFIKAAKWLENTPLGTDNDKRKAMNAWVMMWITKSPTVSIEVNGAITKLFNKNPDLLLVYLAGYARFCLENNYSSDKLKGNVAGVKSAINCYNLGGTTKKDKALANAIAADKDGMLSDWVKQEVMGAK